MAASLSIDDVGFEPDQALALRIEVGAHEPTSRFGRSPRSHKPAALGDKTHDREIATASQRDRMAYFDPIPRDVAERAENIFGDWAGIAYRQANAQEKLAAGTIAAEDLNASNDE